MVFPPNLYAQSEQSAIISERTAWAMCAEKYFHKRFYMGLAPITMRLFKNGIESQRVSKP